VTTLPTWLLVMLGLAGPVVALVVALAAIVAEAVRERDRQRHELAVKHRDERREAYTAFMAACDLLHGGGDQFYEGDRSPEAKAGFRKTFALVRLASSSTAVRDSAHELGNFLLVREPQMEAEGSNPRGVDATYGALLDKFLTAAHRDLDIPPAEPGSPDPA
jgi:hypothetical protein